MGLGPYLRLNVGVETAGVWPLRIPDNETVVDGYKWMLFEARNQNVPFSKPDDPLLDTWPFLLIARTDRIFTAHGHHIYQMGAT
jgi:hypothetical protein